jgi:hypothetical protein
MPDTDRLEVFLLGKAAAEARRQTVIREAHEVFSRAYLFEKARHAAEYERAAARWDAVKASPDAKRYDVAWRAFQTAKLPPDHSRARAALDAAIRAAGAGYDEAIALLNAEKDLAVQQDCR